MAESDGVAAMCPVRPMAAGWPTLVCVLRPRRPAAEKKVGVTQVRRVLMLSWEFPPRIIGGIARHVGELSRALAQRGVEVDVLTAHHPGAPSAEVLPEGGGRVRVMRAAPAPVHPLDFISDIHQLNFSLLERLLSEGEAAYDLVHGTTGWWPSPAAR